MARRLPSQPPTLPGFSFVRVLGSGGFADVFLYEQNLPRRQVAVKVLLSEVVTTRVRQMFQAEANLMAQLSAHPSILTVHQAGVSSDGRPYLVMELCSAALNQEYRARPLSVPDVLRMGVKIASAVETAHRLGVLHRDIKPSNILMSAYGHPVLSDFGIAATIGDLESVDAVGLSIPWSAPEVILDETPGTVASEVWAIGATLYSLLAGRSPFETPGAETSSADLVARITRAKPRPLDRDDVPARLEAILLRAMSKRPESRQSSALEIVRELQTVESELGLVQTSVEVAADSWAETSTSDPADRTRITGIQTIDTAGRRRRRHRPSALEQGARPVGAPVRDSLTPGFVSGPGLVATRTRTVTWLLVAVSVLVVLLGVIATVVLLRAGSAGDIPRVRDVQARMTSSSVTFSWSDPGLAPDDQYQVRVGDGEPSVQKGTTFSVDTGSGERVCLTVAVNRAGRTGPASTEKCVDPESAS